MVGPLRNDNVNSNQPQPSSASTRKPAVGVSGVIKGVMLATLLCQVAGTSSSDTSREIESATRNLKQRWEYHEIHRSAYVRASNKRI